jgi:hypothetical protein
VPVCLCAGVPAARATCRTVSHQCSLVKMLQRAKDKVQAIRQQQTVESASTSQSQGDDTMVEGSGSNLASTPLVVEPVAAAAGPAFPSLGVSLDFLERFVHDKVRGRQSRYVIALQDSAGSPTGEGPPGADELEFQKGEVLAIADISADLHGGWLIGYRRAGDWGDRKAFRADAVERLAGLSTDEVCNDIIKPETQSASWPTHVVERSYAQMVLAQGETGIGTATVFASHAWTFVFEELVQSLRYFEEQQPPEGEPSLFWLDIFVVDENAAHTYPSEWWQTSFTEAVGAIGHTALVLTPWRSPVPLRRAWCLWEIYSTLTKDAKLSVCMSDGEISDFHAALVGGADQFDSILSSLCAIDGERAEAGSQKDLDMIFQAVRSLEGGFQTLNVTVLERMRKWLFDCMTQRLNALGLHFYREPDQYRFECSLQNAPLKANGQMCMCPETTVEDQPTFGNWYRTCPGTKDDDSICAAHYKELPLLQKRKWKAVTCVKHLGAQAEHFSCNRTNLSGLVNIHDELDIASLLLAVTRLVDEMEHDVVFGEFAWDDQLACRRALLYRRSQLGEADPRTAEAMVALSNSESEDVDEKYVLLLTALEVRSKIHITCFDPVLIDCLLVWIADLQGGAAADTLSVGAYAQIHRKFSGARVPRYNGSVALLPTSFQYI